MSTLLSFLRECKSFTFSLGQFVCWYVIRSNVGNFHLRFCFVTYVKCAKLAWARARARARAYKYIVAIVHGVWFYQTKPSFCIFCGSEKLPEPINSEGDERWPLIRSGFTPFPGPFTPPPPPWLDAFWFMKFESGVIPPNSPTIGIELGWSIGPTKQFLEYKNAWKIIKLLLQSKSQMKFSEFLNRFAMCSFVWWFNERRMRHSPDALNGIGPIGPWPGNPNAASPCEWNGGPP